MRKGDVLEIIEPDDSEQLAALEELLDGGRYDEKLADRMRTLLSTVRQPFIVDRFSSDVAGHTERRAWRESLPKDEQEFVHNNLLRGHRLGGVLTYLQAFPMLFSLPGDPRGEKRLALSLIAREAGRYASLLQQQDPDTPSPYDEMPIEQKLELARECREFIVSSLGTILDLYASK